MCPPLPAHPYGSITYSSDSAPPYLFETQATYAVECPEGLERSGGDDVRTCTGDGSSPVGQWNGTAPNCTGIYNIVTVNDQYTINYTEFILLTVVSCGSPPPIRNGSPGTPTSTLVGGTVTYSCYSRYLLSGSATITCQANGTWETSPLCSCKSLLVYGNRHQHQ